jgi:general secretion pathway protein L
LSQLVIRLPPRAIAEDASTWSGLQCAFALTGNVPGAAPTREGVESLSGLSGLMAGVQRVVLLLSASDVSLLEVQVPPMSAARLKAALPNLVEEQLIDDPAQCVVVAAPGNQPRRTVAVVQRAWLEGWVKMVTAYGARQVQAVPAQLCLPWSEERVSAAVLHWWSDADLALRLSQSDGIGLPISNPEGDLAMAVLESVLAVVPEAPVSLYVPPPLVSAYQSALSTLRESGSEGASRVVIEADNWQRWLAAMGRAPLDLAPGLGGASGPQFNWKPLRWPLTLAALVLLINIVGLNYDWWRMRGEANTLRATLTQIFRAAYPKESVVMDPVAQMRQKLAAARRGAGQSSPDDFAPLLASFGEAWNEVAPASSGGAAPKPAAAIAAIEYKDHSLFVRLKPDSPAPTDQMKSALAARRLSLAAATPQSGAPTNATIWQIRSTQ